MTAGGSLSNRSRPTSIFVKKPGGQQGTTVRSNAYTYDAASNILTNTVNTTQVTSYAYDNINQLVNESGPNHSIGYSYDANGNRLTRTTSTGSELYVCDAADKLMEIDGSGTLPDKAFTYDAQGRRKTMTVGTGPTAVPPQISLERLRIPMPTITPPVPIPNPMTASPMVSSRFCAALR